MISMRSIGSPVIYIDHTDVYPSWHDPSGKEGLYFRGKARVFDCEEDMLEALSKDQASFKGTVIVIR